MESARTRESAWPSFLSLYQTGELAERAAMLRRRLKECTLCPRQCKVNRLAGRIGVCRTTGELKVTSYEAHFGEELPLIGWGGSGTIFFTNCNLWCLYCQNYQISHLKEGYSTPIEDLAEVMIDLQLCGCHNINLVTPTHVIPHIVEALVQAARRGLSLPLVYNCGGYESIETLRMLEGIVDIYMPDIKYSSNERARRYSGVKNYWDIVRPAIKEMHRQVGDLVVNNEGVAVRGLIIRHLVLPSGVAGSEEVLRFISEEISKDSYVNIMPQYFPCFKAFMFPELNRRITRDEHDLVIQKAKNMGLHRGFNNGWR